MFAWETAESFLFFSKQRTPDPSLTLFISVAGLTNDLFTGRVADAGLAMFERKSPGSSMPSPWTVGDIES